jgi:hypothetical protein
MTAKPVSRIGSSARTLEAAAIAGIAFSVLYSTGLIVLARRPANTSPSSWEAWILDPANQTWAIVGLNLMAFASIAFLWFMAVIRRRLGDREDRFFSTVFQGAGILNVALILIGSCAVAAVTAAAQSDYGRELTGSDASLMAGFGLVVLLVILPRIQAVFIMTTSTLTLRTKTFRPTLPMLGFLLALGMLLFPLLFEPLGFAFPIWVLVISVALLWRREAIESDGPGGTGEISEGTPPP